MRGVQSIRKAMSAWLIFLITLNFINWSCANEELPCHFFDSKNITSGTRRWDDSILHDGIIYPKYQYATVDYVLEKSKNIAVQPYIRGCTCNITPCLRLCCPIGTIHKRENGTMVCRDHDAARNFEGKVLHENNETKVLTLDDHFAYVEGHPCKKMYFEDDYQIKHVRIFFLNKLQCILTCEKQFKE